MEASETVAAQDSSFRFSSKDGTELFGTFHPADTAVGSALIVHGYADHGARYAEVASELQAAGLNAMYFDYRGHGRAGGNRGVVERFEEYLQDFEAALAELKKRGGDQPLLIVAHSHGALIALHYLADPFRRDESIRAAVISSPFLRLRHRRPAKEFVGRIASRLLPKLVMPNEIRADQLTHDADKIAEHEKDELCHTVASARWFTEACKAQDWVAEFAPRIDRPTLWLVAGQDELADPEQSKRVHSALRADSTYREFPDMRHEVFNEVDRQEVFRELRSFCQHHFREE